MRIRTKKYKYLIAYSHSNGQGNMRYVYKRKFNLNDVPDLQKIISKEFNVENPIIMSIQLIN